LQNSHALTREFCKNVMIQDVTPYAGGEMSIQERLTEDMKQALKAGDKQRLQCIRMLLARLKDRTVALRAEHGREHVLTDEEALEAIAAYAKQRRDSIEAYREAGRDDLAANEQAELDIVATYLPQPLGEDELRALVQTAIAEAGAASAKDMGKVMQLVMPQVKGRADGKQVNRLVRELLGA